jgi:hypothetical protein
MLARLNLLVFALAACLILSCSGKSGPLSPQNPDNPQPQSFHFTNLDENTHVLGIWDVVLDPVHLTVEAVESRSADAHFNVTAMVMPPKCTDCFKVKNLSYDSVSQVMTVDIGFRNPTTNITGRDVRGIIIDFGVMELRNPDCYTDLFSPIPGQIHPFVAYKTGIGQREYPPLSTQWETLQIYDPIFPSIAKFTYVLEASWPDNCKEPYEVEYVDISENLYSDGSNAPTLKLAARDWQNDVASVTVDLAPVGGGLASLAPDPVIQDIWLGPISCAPGTLPGAYRLLVWATTAPPFDQTSDIYNYITVTVVEPPVPNAEVFGPAEQVASTPGQSFIWPRHAVAVTGDGVPHVVWVDNSPDPGSNEYHVYYTERVSDTWSAPQQVDSSSGRAIYATIAADQSDNLQVVWEDERDHVLGSDVYYASSNDSFATETPIVTGADGLRYVHPKVVSASDGTLYLACHSMELVELAEYEYDLWAARKLPGNPSWSAAVSVVSTEDVVEAYPSIAPAPGGGVYMVYSSDADVSNGIYFTRNTTGTFTTPVSVTISDAYQPSIAVAINGSILVTYFNKADGTYSDIFMRISTDQGQTWGNTTAISDSQDAWQIAPDLVTTAEGDVHIAWHEEDDLGYPLRVLYKEYVTGLGWQDTIEISDSGAFPNMAGDINGHIHLVYERLTVAVPPEEDNYDIWYRSSVP